jgi:hypothetical protein
VRLSVATVGSHAQRLLDAAEDGTVIAVFARSLYVRDLSGRIACLGGPGLGAGPVNALCTAWPDEQTVMAGADARWRAGVLALGDSIELEAASAAPWRPAKPDAWRGEAPGRALVRLAAMPARGLGTAIPTLVSQAPLPSGDRFQMAAFQGLLALSLWLRDPVAEPPAIIATLIGLGPGLTPAGDDALGGALVALRVFGRGHTADRLSAWALARARGATSDISFAHLAAAAEGEGAAALHDTLVALAGDSEALGDGVARLDRIGHSSGWDALAGSVAALVALSQPG